MNSIVTNWFDILHMTQAIRGQLIDSLTDADLAYKLPGDNITLGALCREMGQTEQSYIDSFKTFTQSFDYPSVDPALDTSVAKLKAWYETLNRELDAALTALSEDDIQNRTVERGFPMALTAQMHTYREALLIHYGRASCYLKAMHKPMSQQMREWVG